MSNIATTLPLAVEDLAQTIKIIFVGTFIPRSINFTNIVRIRKQKVYNALMWLIQNNHLYKDIQISQNNLDKLPEDDVPKVLLETMKVYEKQDNHEGYVKDPLNEDEKCCYNEDVPINTTALVDTDGVNINPKIINEEILKEFRATNSNEPVYAIPHTGRPVNEYNNPELLMSLYPTLFPYGCGGIEDLSKPTRVTFEKHIQYLLKYADRRFERNHSFMFIAFNILQKRSSCRQAKILVSRPYFGKKATDIMNLTNEDVEIAIQNIDSNDNSIKTNPKLQSLLQQIKTVGGAVDGSNYSRSKYRYEIHSIIYEKGLPSIFLTINPADVHSRVAMQFSGINIEVQKIFTDKLPELFERAKIIARNPVATARFFNLLITTLLETLISPPNEKEGIFGPTKSYYGTVGKYYKILPTYIDILQQGIIY